MIGEIGLRAPPFPIDFDEPLERLAIRGRLHAGTDIRRPVPALDAGGDAPRGPRFRAERPATQIARFRRPQAPAGRQQGNGFQRLVFPTPLSPNSTTARPPVSRRARA